MRYITKLNQGCSFQVTIQNTYVGCFTTEEEAAKAADNWLITHQGPKAKWRLNNPALISLTALAYCGKCNCTKTLSDFKPPTTRNYKDVFCHACIIEQKAKANAKARLNNPNASGKYRKTLIGFLSFMVSSARDRAKKRPYKCEITKEDLMQIYANQNGRCVISGYLMTWGSGNGRVPTHMSLDRIDSAQGYTYENVQIVCDVINTMKSASSTADFVHWCRLVAQAQEHSPAGG